MPIIELTVSNFRTWRTPQSVSFGGSVPNPTETAAAMGQGVPFPRSCAIVSRERSSGASDLVQLLRVFQRLVACPTAPSKLPYRPFERSGTAGRTPTQVSVGWLHQTAIYRYTLVFDASRIWQEFLTTQHVPNRKERLFERTYHPATRQYRWRFGTAFAQAEGGNFAREAAQEATSSRALFLSTATAFGSAALSPVHHWLSGQLQVIDRTNPLPPDVPLELLDSPGGGKKLMTFLRQVDAGITGMHVKRNTSGEATIIVSHEVDDATVYCTALDAGWDGNLSAQAAAIRTLIALAAPWLRAAEHGGVLVIDDLDRGLTAAYIQALLSVLHARTLLPPMQLIFTVRENSAEWHAAMAAQHICFTESRSDGASRFCVGKSVATEHGGCAGRHH